MCDDAWIEIPHDRYTEVWDRFDATFQFKPSVRPDDWPTFRELDPFVTWDIGELLGEFDPWSDPLATPYNLALLTALKAFVPDGEPVLALDWQHTSYEFYPHRFRQPEEPTHWRIPALPAGDYHLFVTEDHRLGSLGHPWEETLCVFGQGFLTAYRQASPLQKHRIARQS